MTAIILLQMWSGLLGVIQTVCVARWIGPEFLGMVATIAGIYAVIANFFDLRLFDTASRLLNDEEPGRNGSAIVAAGGVIQLILGTASWIVSAVLAIYLQGYFLQEQFGTGDIVRLTAAPALGFLSNFLQYVERFAAPPNRVAAVQCGVATVSTAVFLGMLGMGDSAAMYSWALLIAACVTALAHLYFAAAFFGIHAGDLRIRAGAQNYWRERKLLVSTNLLGYVKMLHRGADVLLVAYVSTEQVTGLYKLGRSLTESMFLGIDVLQRQFQPNVFRLLGDKDTAGFSRFVTLSAKLTVLALLLIPLAVYPIQIVTPLIFGGAYADSVPFILLLIVPQILSAGINLWLWPLILMSRSVGFYSVVSLVAVLVVQYGVAFPITIWGGVSPMQAALILTAATVVIYPINYFAAFWFVRKRHPEYIRSR